MTFPLARRRSLALSVLCILVHLVWPALATAGPASTLDARFGQAGRVAVAPAIQLTAFDSDGAAYLLVPQGVDGSPADGIQLRRLTPRGHPDLTFGSGGTLHITTTGTPLWLDVDNGSPVLAILERRSVGSWIALARISPNGASADWTNMHTCVPNAGAAAPQFVIGHGAIYVSDNDGTNSFLCIWTRDGETHTISQMQPPQLGIWSQHGGILFDGSGRMIYATQDDVIRYASALNGTYDWTPWPGIDGNAIGTRIATDGDGLVAMLWPSTQGDGIPHPVRLERLGPDLALDHTFGDNGAVDLDMDGYWSLAALVHRTGGGWLVPVQAGGPAGASYGIRVLTSSGSDDTDAIAGGVIKLQVAGVRQTLVPLLETKDGGLLARTEDGIVRFCFESSACPAASPDGPTRPRSISGVSVRGGWRVGSMLRCTAGTWSGVGPHGLHPVWERRAHRRWMTTGTPRWRYRVRRADTGHLVRCRVTAQNGSLTGTAVSTARRIRKVA